MNGVYLALPCSPPPTRVATGRIYKETMYFLTRRKASLNKNPIVLLLSHAQKKISKFECCISSGSIWGPIELKNDFFKHYIYRVNLTTKESVHKCTCPKRAFSFSRGSKIKLFIAVTTVYKRMLISRLEVCIS